MFVTLEGPEGGGKSTALAALARRLTEAGYDIVTTREPGATDFGRQVRHLLLEGPELVPESELFLFLADRADHVMRVVKPSLEAGRIVVCDRYADSTVVYQGYGRGLDVEVLRTLNALATAGLQPDLTLLFDLDPEVGLARLGPRDRLDQEPLDFHRRVRQGFLTEASRDPDRWVVLDAGRPAPEVEAGAWQAILGRLSAAAGA